jgi:hypothetical protein
MFEDLSSNPSYRISWKKCCDPESLGCPPKIPQIKCDQDICLAIHRRFQDHLIVWVAELWPPQKMRFHWLSHRNHCLHKNAGLPFRECRRNAMFASVANRFVFQCQWDGQ